MWRARLGSGVEGVRYRDGNVTLKDLFLPRSPLKGLFVVSVVAYCLQQAPPFWLSCSQELALLPVGRFVFL